MEHLAVFRAILAQPMTPAAVSPYGKYDTHSHSHSRASL